MMRLRRSGSFRRYFADQFHDAATLGAAHDPCLWLFRRLGIIGCFFHNRLHDFGELSRAVQQFFDFLQTLAMRRRQKAVVPHFDEAVRQHVLQEASNKFFRCDCPGFKLFGLAVAILKRDVVIFQFQQAAVADGNAEDVRREILERVLAGADGPAIDDPILFPGIWRHLVKQFRLLVLERVTKLGAENFRQRFDRHEKLPSHRQPPRPIWRQTAAGDDEVQMRMIRQIARPGLQHAKEAKLAADEFWIVRQFLQSGRRGLEEEAVDERLMAARHRVECIRQREGEHEIRHWQQQRALHLEPFIGFVITTFWAMPILAGVITVAILLARLAEKNSTAEFFGAAGLDFLHDRAVARRHARAVFLQVGGAIFAENIRELKMRLVVALINPP